MSENIEPNPDAWREEDEAKRIYAQQAREESFRHDLGIRSRSEDGIPASITCRAGRLARPI